MPYDSNADLPQSIKDKYSAHCAGVFRRVFNENHSKGEAHAFRVAHTAAKNCQSSQKAALEILIKLEAGVRAWEKEHGHR